jgi:hypothetical protein
MKMKVFLPLIICRGANCHLVSEAADPARMRDQRSCLSRKMAFCVTVVPTTVANIGTFTADVTNQGPTGREGRRLGTANGDESPLQPKRIH